MVRSIRSEENLLKWKIWWWNGERGGSGCLSSDFLTSSVDSEMCNSQWCEREASGVCGARAQNAPITQWINPASSNTQHRNGSESPSAGSKVKLERSLISIKCNVELELNYSSFFFLSFGSVPKLIPHHGITWNDVPVSDLGSLHLLLNKARNKLHLVDFFF